MSLFDPTPSDESLQTPEGLLTLLALPGIGPARAIALAQRFPGPETLAAATASELTAAAGKAAAALVGLRISVPDRIAADFDLIGYFDANYPHLLRSIPAPPAVLWSVGTTPSSTAIAVVGTREPSAWGRSAARSAASSAAAHGYGIVSGLALGIDTEAHLGALETGAPTWAVLGCGVDAPTPAANRELAQHIVAAGGGLIAEVPPGTRPSAQTLVARNRLQAGWARATVIAQCGIPSGTLHTARFTLEQAKPLVVALPETAMVQDDPEFAGCRALANPDGCDPDILGARGKTAALIGRKRPVADLVAHRSDDLDKLWPCIHPT